ncbi:MAG: hypothetical protein HJJLKODD_02022 [Phycisphaerae bacterium]|nr:hypothetical protein [Phycisphaerae bacterium]
MISRAEQDTQPPVAQSSFLISAVVARLAELAELVRLLSAEQYQQVPPGFDSGSIGQHVRHSLDHFSNLLDGLKQGLIDYDQRARGTAVESDRQTALELIEQLTENLCRRAGSDLNQPLRLRAIIAADGSQIETCTTLQRELLFILSHTVHHDAMMAVAARMWGVAVPEHFGFAPATLAYLQHAG